MFDRVHHSGIAVGDLDAAKGIFSDALGLKVDGIRSPYPGGRKQRGADPTDILDIPIGYSELELNAAAAEGTGVHRFVESPGGRRRAPSRLPAHRQHRGRRRAS